jgi:hypothetical protein
MNRFANGDGGGGGSDICRKVRIGEFDCALNSSIKGSSKMYKSDTILILLQTVHDIKNNRVKTLVTLLGINDCTGRDLNEIA